MSYDEKSHLETQIAQEITAFLALYPQLWQIYPHQYVAIYQEQLIDHDTDFAPLFARVEEQYADEFVLIRRVEAEPETVYHFCSPRWIIEENLADMDGLAIEIGRYWSEGEMAVAVIEDVRRKL